MKRIVMFVMSTITAVVLLLGYHTSTSSRAAGGETAFVSTVQAGMAAKTAAAQITQPAPTAAAATTSAAATNSAVATTTAAGPTTGAATTSAAATSSAAAATSSATSSAAATTSAAATSSTVQGAVTQTRWGPVQVQLSLSNGKITAVTVLQYPNGNGKDGEINSYALPILVQETISAQSAKIDMVSGATVTSNGYLGSLQSALDQAGL